MLTYTQFLTDLERCPYLHDRPSRLEVRLLLDLSPDEHEAQLAAGVRHFGRSYFRPACPGCSECVSLRIPVGRFRPSKSQRRVLRRNADIELEIGEPTVDDQRLELYRRFHANREERRGWPPSGMDYEEYVASFVDNPAATLEFCYRLEGRLVAVAYVDETPNAFNSVFGYYCPDHRRRSLGTFDILAEIREARGRGKEYLYMGYYVAGCPSMEYKKDFAPHELLEDAGWLPR